MWNSRVNAHEQDFDRKFVEPTGKWRKGSVNGKIRGFSLVYPEDQVGYSFGGTEQLKIQYC